MDPVCFGIAFYIVDNLTIPLYQACSWNSRRLWFVRKILSGDGMLGLAQLKQCSINADGSVKRWQRLRAEQVVFVLCTTKTRILSGFKASHFIAKHCKWAMSWMSRTVPLSHHVTWRWFRRRGRSGRTDAEDRARSLSSWMMLRGARSSWIIENPRWTMAKGSAATLRFSVYYPRARRSPSTGSLRAILRRSALAFLLEHFTLSHLSFMPHELSSRYFIISLRQGIQKTTLGEGLASSGRAKDRENWCWHMYVARNRNKNNLCWREIHSEMQHNQFPVSVSFFRSANAQEFGLFSKCLHEVWLQIATLLHYSTALTHFPSLHTFRQKYYHKGKGRI